MAGVYITMIMVITGYTVYRVRTYRKSALLINMAGRQRVLSQKFVKELFRYYAQQNSGVPVAKPDLTKTGNLFKTTLNSFIEGGTVFTDFEGEKALFMKPTENTAALSSLKRVRQNWMELEKLSSLLFQGDLFPGIFKKIISLEQEILSDMNQAVMLYEKEADMQIHHLIIMEMVFLGISLLLGIIGYILGRKSVVYIIKASESAQEIAIGNLNIADLYGESGDEVGVMTTALTDLKKTITNIVERIQSVSMNINQSVNQIIFTSKEAAEHSQNQAASLKETTVTLEQLTETVKQNTNVAQNANDLAKSTLEIATIGESVVRETIKSMTKVNKSSQKISQIVGVVNEIAFKTNLLALNAAVEAARAGDQGRGFGVVAGEVRDLASQCAAAVKEIRTLIEDSRRKVVDGNNMVEETGKNFEEIIAGVKKLAESNSNISQASEEQSSNLDEIYQTVKNMEVMVQENVLKVEDSSLKAGKMIAEVDSLEKAIYIFTSSNMTGKRECSVSPDASWITGQDLFQTIPKQVQPVIPRHMDSQIADFAESRPVNIRDTAIEGFDEF